VIFFPFEGQIFPNSEIRLFGTVVLILAYSFNGCQLGLSATKGMAVAMVSAIRVTFILVLCSAVFCREDEIATGRWEGSAQIPGREMKLIVDLAPDGSGKWSGSIILPGFDLKGAPLKDVTRNGSDLSFSLDNALSAPGIEPPKFTGHMEANGKLSGELIQAGNRAPFSLEKIGPPQVEPVVRSTSIAKELEGEWKGGYELDRYPRKVTIKLCNRGAEGAMADFLIVGRKENHLPVDLVRQEGAFLTIDSHITGLSFEGTFRDGEIKGVVMQGPLEIPLVMRRAK
jgi:hypothetical protein